MVALPSGANGWPLLRTLVAAIDIRQHSDVHSLLLRSRDYSSMYVDKLHQEIYPDIKTDTWHFRLYNFLYC
jgi:hypothetical protein